MQRHLSKAFTLATMLVRAIAYALLLRVTGLDALGVQLPLSAWVDIAAQATGLDLEGALQRFTPAVREAGWIEQRALS
jgi:hypothetical protein